MLERSRAADQATIAAAQREAARLSLELAAKTDGLQQARQQLLLSFHIRFFPASQYLLERASEVWSTQTWALPRLVCAKCKLRGKKTALCFRLAAGPARA